MIDKKLILVYILCYSLLNINWRNVMRNKKIYGQAFSVSICLVAIGTFLGLIAMNMIKPAEPLPGMYHPADIHEELVLYGFMLGGTAGFINLFVYPILIKKRKK